MNRRHFEVRHRHVAVASQLMKVPGLLMLGSRSEDGTSELYSTMCTPLAVGGNEPYLSHLWLCSHTLMAKRTCVVYAM